MGKYEHTLFCYGGARADIYGAYFWLNSFESCSCAFSTSSPLRAIYGSVCQLKINLISAPHWDSSFSFLRLRSSSFLMSHTKYRFKKTILYYLNCLNYFDLRYSLLSSGSAKAKKFLRFSLKIDQKRDLKKKFEKIYQILSPPPWFFLAKAITEYEIYKSQECTLL